MSSEARGTRGIDGGIAAQLWLEAYVSMKCQITYILLTLFETNDIATYQYFDK